MRSSVFILLTNLLTWAIRRNNRFNRIQYLYCLHLKGSSIGVALTFPFCGYILENFGWPYVFYSTGVIGIVWFLAWWLLVYDTPAQHPYISQEELVHITSSLTNVVSSVKVNAVICITPRFVRPPKSRNPGMDIIIGGWLFFYNNIEREKTSCNSCCVYFDFHCKFPIAYCCLLLFRWHSNDCAACIRWPCHDFWNPIFSISLATTRHLGYIAF